MPFSFLFFFYFAFLTLFFPKKLKKKKLGEQASKNLKRDKICLGFFVLFFYLALFGPGSPTDHCSAHANLPTQYIYESLSKKI